MNRIYDVTEQSVHIYLSETGRKKRRRKKRTAQEVARHPAIMRSREMGYKTEATEMTRDAENHDHEENMTCNSTNFYSGRREPRNTLKKEDQKRPIFRGLANIREHNEHGRVQGKLLYVTCDEVVVVELLDAMGRENIQKRIGIIRSDGTNNRVSGGQR